MFLCGRVPSKSSSYSPLVERGRGDQRSRDIEVISQWFAECSDHDAEQVLEAVAIKRPELVLSASRVAHLRRSQTKLMQGRDSRHPTRKFTPRIPLTDRQPPVTVQFSSQYYYCLEEEPSIKLEVMRLHGGGEVSQVHWTTKDMTATSGRNYERASGVLVFMPHEKEKNIEIKLIDDSSWGGVIEFHVLLKEEGLSNATLSTYLKVARVQRIDDDVFPTNKYKKQILSRGVDQLNYVMLLYEYFKLNLSDPAIKHGTVKTILLGQLHNLFFVFKLWTDVLLVSCIMNKSAERYQLKLRLEALVLYAFLPMALLHFLDFKKQGWGVSGKARMNLSSGLVNAFLNYNDTSRTEIKGGDLVEAMTNDTETLIKAGYSSFLAVFQIIGQIAMCMVFQLAAKLSAGPMARSTLFTMLQMMMFPVLMVALLAGRKDSTNKAIAAKLKAKATLVYHANDMVTNFRLIADFQKRDVCLDQHEANVQKFSSSDTNVNKVLLNNRYMMEWMSVLSVLIYTLLGGLDVIDGHIPPGVFLTCLKVFLQVGAMWGKIYGICIDALESMPSLERMVHFTNLPSDVRERMLWSRKQREDTHNAIQELLTPQSSRRPGQSYIDMIPIRIKNVTLNLKTSGKEGDAAKVRETPMFFDFLEIEQGKLVSLVGKSGEGKSTLLKIIGGALLPRPDEESVFFIPSHLRVLHVTHESMFIKGGLYDNLIFGTTAGHPDGRPERVSRICERLGLPAKIIEHITPEHVGDASWAESLSSSEKHLLTIARALITNPEILCIHKPTLNVNTKNAECVVTLLREFVDRRGLEQDEAELHLRRPRTCILTSTGARNLEHADMVYKVDAVNPNHTSQRIMPVSEDLLSLKELATPRAGPATAARNLPSVRSGVSARPGEESDFLPTSSLEDL